MKKILCFVLVLSLVLGIACAKTKDKKKKNSDGITPVNYTSEDAVNYEIQTIKKLQEKEPLQALWRSKILLDETKINTSIESIYKECENVIVSRYKKDISKKNYISALRYFESLEAVDYSDLKSLPLQKEQLYQKMKTDIPGLTINKESQNKKVSELIKGTVTVYVDKGIKVERGVGYTDGVLGSGFFISKNGYIITNHHVISDCVDPEYEGFARLYIRLADDSETRIPAKIIGYDKSVDLALLKTEVDAPYVFNLGSSTDLDVGDKVYAIGSPLGLERTITSGIISSKDRDLFSTGKVFQIDAAVNSGNSGGPLVDENGNVQAVVFAGVPLYQGLNFAIPVEYLRYELPILFAGGERIHPWMASYGKTKRLVGMGAANIGVNVCYVMPGGYADFAGLGAGDTITSINGEKISTIDELTNNFLKRIPNTILKVGIINVAGKQSTKLIYIGKRPKSPGYEVYNHDVIGQALIPLIGMDLVPSSTINKKLYTIRSIIKGSAADEAGFSESDPVQILKTEISSDKDYISIQIYAKKRKNGFLDIALGLQAPLDSPYYF